MIRFTHAHVCHLRMKRAKCQNNNFDYSGGEVHVPVELVPLDAQWIVLVFMGAHEVLTGLFPLLACFLIPACVCVCLSAESVGLRNKLLRKVQELKNEADCSGIPDELLCPITRELMRDPVIASGRQRPAPTHVTTGTRDLSASLWTVTSSRRILV